MPLAKSSIHAPQNTCQFGTVVAGLNKADREILTEWFDRLEANHRAGNNKFGIATIEHGLREDGIKVGADTIRRHAKGSCACTTPDAFHGVI